MTFITTDEQLARVVRKEVSQALKSEKEKPAPETLYTIAETARILKKSYTTVCRMIQQKRIIATSDGRYISQRSIDNYIEGVK